MAAGQPISISHEAATITREQIGGHAAGWFQFQPIWDDIVAECPDFLD
jgi:hypothetical protein